MNTQVSFALMDRLVSRTALGQAYFTVTATMRHATVHVVGDVDRYNVWELEQQLAEAELPVRPLTIDLALCTFLDLAAIRVLLAAHTRLGNRLHIIKPQRAAFRRLLDLAGL